MNIQISPRLKAGRNRLSSTIMQQLYCACCISCVYSVFPRLGRGKTVLIPGYATTLVNIQFARPRIFLDSVNILSRESVV